MAKKYIVKYKYKYLLKGNPVKSAIESMPFLDKEEAKKFYKEEMKRIKKQGVDFYEDIEYRYIDEVEIIGTQFQINEYLFAYDEGTEINLSEHMPMNGLSLKDRRIVRR